MPGVPEISIQKNRLRLYALRIESSSFFKKSFLTAKPRNVGQYFPQEALMQPAERQRCWGASSA